MCREIWRAIQSTGTVASHMWEWVYGPWVTCSAQRCIWWCLCCNKWLCWIALILLAVLLIAFLILYVVWVLVLLIVCESLCVLVAILQSPSGNVRVHCFQYWDQPTPSGGPASGSGALTSPPTGTGVGVGTGVGTGANITAGERAGDAAPRTALAQQESQNEIALCGCREGRLGLVLGIGLFVFLVVGDWQLIHATGWPVAVFGLGIPVVGALAGKIVGMFRARAVFQRSTDAAARQL